MRRDGARSGPGISASQPILPGLLRSPSRHEAARVQQPRDFGCAAHTAGAGPAPRQGRLHWYGVGAPSDSQRNPPCGSGLAPRWAAQQTQDLTIESQIIGAPDRPRLAAQQTQQFTLLRWVPGAFPTSRVTLRSRWRYENQDGIYTRTEGKQGWVKAGASYSFIDPLKSPLTPPVTRCFSRSIWVIIGALTARSSPCVHCSL